MDYNILSHKDKNEHSIKDLSPDFLNLGVRGAIRKSYSLSSVTFTVFFSILSPLLDQNSICSVPSCFPYKNMSPVYLEHEFKQCLFFSSTPCSS